MMTQNSGGQPRSMPVRTMRRLRDRCYQKVRRHKAAVIAFFCGLVIVAGSSPFVWAMLATAIPAVQPIGLLSIFALAAPGPAYFLLRYQLGWL